MNRRGFFKLFGLGIAGIALEQAVPLGRVWSFPSEIMIPEPFVGTGNLFLTTEFISMEVLRNLKNNLHITESFATDWEKGFGREFPIGETVQMHVQMRFEQVNEVIDRWNSDSTAADPHLSALITS